MIDMKRIKQLLSMIIDITNENFDIHMGYDKLLLIRIDLHGYKCLKAKITIQNIINLLKNMAFRLEIIHGFNHDDAIKRMLHDENTLQCPRIIKRWVNVKNPGISNLVIAA